jgi:hypothetical protein
VKIQPRPLQLEDSVLLGCDAVSLGHIQDSRIFDYTAVKTSKLAWYTSVGRLLCNTFGDFETFENIYVPVKL